MDALIGIAIFVGVFIVIPMLATAHKQTRQLMQAEQHFLNRVRFYAWNNHGHDQQLYTEIVAYSHYIVEAMTKHTKDRRTLHAAFDAIEADEVATHVITWRG